MFLWIIKEKKNSGHKSIPFHHKEYPGHVVRNIGKNECALFLPLERKRIKIIFPVFELPILKPAQRESGIIPVKISWNYSDKEEEDPPRSPPA